MNLPVDPASPVRASSRSITSRLTMLGAVAASAMLIAVMSISYWRLSHYFKQDSLAFLADELREYRAQVKKSPTDALEQIHTESAAHSFSPYYVRLLDEDGELVATSPHAPDTLHHVFFPEPIATTDMLGATARHRLPNGRWFLTTAAWAETPVADRQWLLQVALDITHDEEVLRQYRRTLIVVSLAGLSLFIGVAAGIVHYSMRPLRTITQTAQRITAQHLDERLVPSGWPKELAILAHAFDGMLDRLEATVAHLRQFSADLAHELRTPIQNLMWDTEVTLARVRTETEYQKGLTNNFEELKHLAAMVDDLLFLARTESPQRDLGWQAFDAAQALWDAWDFFDAMAEAKGVSVTYQGHGIVQAEPQLFRRALTNLLSNALRHTPSDGTITLAVEPQADGACKIRVSDTGCGIAPEHLPYIFDRLYQVEPDRPRSSDGTGLGLAIVKSIMELHGGAVDVHSTPSQGTTFTLFFPPQPTLVR